LAQHFPQLGHTKLKELAHDEIKAQVRSNNIVTELRSSFTSMHVFQLASIYSFSVADQKMVLARYESIRDMQIAFACENDNLPVILEVIPEWMTELASSGTPQAAVVLGNLFQKAVAAAFASASASKQVMHGKECSFCGQHTLTADVRMHRFCTQCRVFRMSKVR
jgi:hypothetical protein